MGFIGFMGFRGFVWAMGFIRSEFGMGKKVEAAT